MFYQSKLHYNSILTSSVDSYCLVCDSYLRSEDEAITHTEKPIHKKNMGAARRLDKYPDDQIIKVKRGYFCTFCNTLLSTSTKVSLHIGDVSHRANKGARMLKQVGDHVIAFDEVAISLETWHGMTENSCVICNTEFKNNDIHRSEQRHILLLIQAKCEFGDDYIYRKVDEESFFCLTCASVFAIGDKPEHHENIKHKMLYNQCKELKNKIPTVPQVKAQKTTKITPAKPENKTKNNKTNSIKSLVAETAKKNAAAAESDAATLSTTTMGPTKPVDSKKTGAIDIEKTETINAKNDTVNDNNTELVNATKVEIQPTQNSIKQSDNNMQKVDDFFDSATELISADKDLKIEEYMSVSNYIVQDDAGQMRCVLCDVICRKEDVKVHLSNDLHHQMMLKKHKETLYKKKNGPTAEISEIFPADNLVQFRGKIYLDQPENAAICAAVGRSKPVIKETIPQQRQLETALPLDIQSKIRRHNPDSDVSSDEDEEYKTKILDKVDQFQHNDITVDIASEKAYCKRCDDDLAFEPAALERHINERHVNVKTGLTNNEIVSLRTKMITYGRENYIVVLQDDAYCKLCNIQILFDMKSMVEHVNSGCHKDKVAKKNGLGPLKKIQAIYFLESFFRVESSLGSDIVLNNKYVLRHYSFHCVILEGDNYKCVLCDVEFSKDGGEQLTNHLNTVVHKSKLALCNVVSSLPLEFIREIKSGVYHCGYCNKAMDRWLYMQDHLLHQSHINARRHAMWNLERCNSVIRSARAMQARRGHIDSDPPPAAADVAPPSPSSSPSPAPPAPAPNVNNLRPVQEAREMPMPCIPEIPDQPSDEANTH